MTKTIALEIGLDEEIVNALSAIFRATPVIDEVIIFGSRAKGNFRDGSDIDLALKGKGITIDTILDLGAIAEDLGWLYKIEFHDYARISNPDLKDHIDRVGKLLWSRKSDKVPPKGALICDAIRKMQQIKFVYNGKPRVVEPQFFGIGKKGYEQLRGYQVNEKPQLEKLFDVEKIENLELLSTHFSSPGPHYNSNDSAFALPICRLK